MIKIVYVDDNLEENLSEYLDSVEIESVEIETEDSVFNSSDTYQDLLDLEIIQEANILIIDSRLFEESTLENEDRLTGEQFKVILKKEFPFIEVIIVSQNEDSLNLGFVPKFNSRKAEKHKSASFENHYMEHLFPEIEKSIEKINANRLILEQIKQNKNIDSSLVNLIDNSINGVESYKTLTSEDIDKLINEFKSISIHLEEKDDK